MPGTIQVSALDLVGLELSSSPLQQLPIRVSLGKSEYQTLVNGDLYIPLTSLRDKLVITVLDAEGNRVSHTWIETRMVIEKGIWDDLFPLEGGGFVHMRLQFVLSEEDRNRIRTMRELALRKKNEELQNSKLINPESPDSNPQSKEIHAQTGQISTNPSTLVKDVEPDRGDVKGTHSFQKRLSAISTDESENTSSTVKPVTFLGGGLSSPVGSSRHRSTVTEASNFRKSFLVGVADNKLPAKLNREETNEPENLRPKGKTRSHVRKMIIAFESSINQDVKPKINQQPIKSQSSKQGDEIPPKSSHGALAEAKLSQDDRFQAVQSAACVGALGTNNHSETSAEVSERISRSRRGYVPGIKVFKLIVCRFPFFNLFLQKLRIGNLLSRRSANGTHPQNSHQKSILGVSNDGHDTLEFSGFWIFADERRHLCVTTGGKQVMNLMEHCLAEEKSNRRGEIHFSTEDGQKVGHRHGNAEDGERTSLGSELGNASSGAEGSRGPVGQVMRVAIMVGFATLVLFTRQRTHG